MSGHTPGLWTAEVTEAPVTNGQAVGSPTGNILAGDGRAGRDWIASVKPFSDDFYANARLIAAAPDLLEACRAALSMPTPWIKSEQGRKDQRAYRRVFAAAIAKAEGSDDHP